MSEIKFRYIVKHIESGNIEVKKYYLTQIEERPLTSLSPVFVQGYELLSKDQYTRLKDKNGVEIYEGDILQLGKTRMRIYFSPMRGYRVEATNKWHYDVSELLEFQDVEVVGNIYQNKNSLEESK